MAPSVESRDRKRTIQVAVRVRPTNASEKAERAIRAVKVDNNRLIVKNHQSLGPDKIFSNFDKVYGPSSKQVDIYKDLVAPLLVEVLEGFNGTIFAYGQTGTGKTFTMEGERGEQTEPWDTNSFVGIIPRTLQHLFDKLESQKTNEFSVRVSYIELYNEEVFDLLGPLDPHACKRKLFEDPHNKGSVVVQGMEEVVVRDRQQVYDILKRGADKRKTAETLLNASSSRSHAVFSICVHVREQTLDGREMIKQGKLNLVDLAGSENIGRSGAVRERAKEAGTINQSLLTLGRVINCLVEHRGHIPYRESKLTRLLQDSLGGKTITTIIATLSPSSNNLEETLSTLDYAERAKNIKNSPAANQKLTQIGLIKEYTDEIERLRKDLAATRNKDGVMIAAENYEAMQERIAKQESEIEEVQENLEMVNSEMEKRMEDLVIMNQKWRATWRKKDRLQEKLDEKREQQRQTAQALLLSEREVDQTKYILGAQEEMGESLRSTAKELAQISDKATQEVYALQSKVQKLQSVSAVNYSTTLKCSERLLQSGEELSETHDEYVNEVTSTILDALRQLENLSVAQKSISDRKLNSGEALTGNVSGQVAQMERVFVTSLKQGTQSMSNMKEAAAQIKAAGVSGVNSLNVDTKVSCEGISHAVEAMGSLLKQTLLGVHDQMAQLLTTSQKNMDNQVKSLKKSHAKEVEAYEAQISQSNERCLRLNQIEEALNSAMGGVHQLKSNETKLSGMVEVQHAHEKQSHEEQVSQSHTTHDDNTNLVNNVTDELKSVAEKEDTLLEECSGKSAAIIQTHENTSRALVEALEIDSNRLQSDLMAECGNLESLAKELQSNCESIHETITEDVRVVQETKGLTDEETSQCFKAGSSTLNLALGVCKAMKEGVGAWIGEHQVEAQNIVSHWEHEQNTGKTPARHHFKYSTTLAQRLNKEALLEVFEQENTPLDLNFDSSVLDESSFMVSPPPPSTPKSASSANSDGYSFSTPGRPLKDRN